MNSPGLIINAVGDICLGDSLISLGFGVRSTIAREGSAFIFDPARSVLQDSDLLFGNLECVLSDIGMDPAKPKTRYLRGAPSGIETITDGGFHVLNIANNHTLQYGEQAFAETLQAVRRAGIEVAGTTGPPPYYSTPIIMTRRGLTVGILAYSYEWEQYFKGEPLYATGIRENILEDIRRLAPEVDYVLVSLHWGLEYMTRPSGDMVDLAHDIIDAGCRVVLGHHPHVLMGTERYNGGVIAYSLGNFVFDKMWWKTCLNTVVARISLPEAPDQAVHMELIPMKINRNFQPVPLEGRDEQSARRNLERLDRTVDKAYARTLLPYNTIQKMKLQALNLTKLVHILKNFRRYQREDLRFLVKDKILRMG